MRAARHDISGAVESGPHRAPAGDHGRLIDAPCERCLGHKGGAAIGAARQDHGRDAAVEIAHEQIPEFIERNRGIAASLDDPIGSRGDISRRPCRSPIVAHAPEHETAVGVGEHEKVLRIGRVHADRHLGLIAAALADIHVGSDRQRGSASASGCDRKQAGSGQALSVGIGDRDILGSDRRSRGCDVQRHGSRAGEGRAIDHDTASDRAGDPFGESRARIEKTRACKLSARHDDIHVALSGGNTRRIAQGWRRGRRSEELRGAHAVAVVGVAEFLERPHRHVVLGIEAGVGIVAPPLDGARALRRVGRPAIGVKRGRLHRAQRIGGEAAAGGGVWVLAGTCGREAHRHVALAGNQNRRDCEKPRVRRRGIEDRPRLHHARRAGQILQFIPARRGARGRSSGAGAVHADVVGRPQPAIANVRREEPVIQRVKRRGRAQLRPGQRIRRRGHGDAEISRDRGRAAGIAHAADMELPKIETRHADEIALRGRRIVIVHALRSEWTVHARRQQIAKRRHHDRPRAEDRTFPHDECRAPAERTGRRKHVVADVERVVVDAERRVVGEIIRVAGRRDEIVLEKEERERGRIRNRRPAAHREEHPIRQRAPAAGHVDDDHNPAPREPVVADVRITREIAARRRRHHRIEKRVHAHIERAVCHPGRLVESADASVDRDHELRWPDRAHRIRRERTRVRERRAGEVGADHLRRERPQAFDFRAGLDGRRERRVWILRQAAPIRSEDWLDPRRTRSLQGGVMLARHDARHAFGDSGLAGPRRAGGVARRGRGEEEAGGEDRRAMNEYAIEEAAE